MYNKVIFIGNLGKDPEIRKLEGGVSVGKFPIATNENFRDSSGEWQQRTEWHDIVVWRHLAERAERDLKKGSLVFVEGKLTHRKWQDKEGNNRYSTEVVANTLRTLDKTSRGEGYSTDSFPDADDMPGAEKSEATESTSEDVDDLPF
ncbi:MAG: single-stranded DNA-binding protein [Saprospiraceae bacterium]|nr:single-stranded DNA-binding protein [Saprospiraceae bacterium]